MTAPRLTALVVGLALAQPLLASRIVAQEHPSEHPKPAEHPKSQATGVSKEDLGAAVEAYIKGETAKGGGVWKFEDKDEKAMLSLTLDKVHKDKLAMTDKDTYFACADFKNADGHTYDLDVFMRGPDKAHLEATEVSVHKKDGKERYTWAKDGNLWKKVPVGEAKK